jgi:hypothetical protein
MSSERPNTPERPDTPGQDLSLDCEETVPRLFEILEELRTMMARQSEPRVWEPTPEPPPEEDLA